MHQDQWVDVAGTVTAVLDRHPGITRVEVVGSRSRGTATALSDWDFVIAASELDVVCRDLPTLVQPLRPLASQWDRLSPRALFMLILPGAIKIDLFPGELPYAVEGPWEPHAENLAQIDAHFWDWILWLGGKVLARRSALVASELDKLEAHLLGPLGGVATPGSVAEAVASFLELREAAEARYGVAIDRRLGEEVAARLGSQGLT